MGTAATVLGVVLVSGGAWLAMRMGVAISGLPPVAARPEPTPRKPWVIRWLRSLVRLVVQLVPEYVVIVGLLGFARALLFPAAGPDVGNNLLIMVGLAVAGTLFVIPTAGEIPIIQTSSAMGSEPAQLACCC